MASDDSTKYRNKVIEELVMTEKTYLNGLKNLITVFIDPLETDSVISDIDYHIIFPKDIKIIYHFHEILLTEFQKEFKNLNIRDESNIGKIFIDHAQMFKMYQNYLNNHHKATQKLSQLQKKKKFVKWCIKAQSKINNQTLSSLLILPIQRCPRYELLLKELIKRTQKINRKHRDLKDLNKALIQISAINQIINIRMEEYEKREKVKQIKEKFDATSLSIEIIIPSRYFIMDNDDNNNNHKIINKHDKFGKTINLYMVLFNDGVIYGHFKSNTISIGSSIIFDNFLPFNIVFEIEDIKQCEKYKKLYCMKILSSNESIWISFKSESYKMEWINNINDALNIKLNKNKNIRNIHNNENELIQSVCLIPDNFSDFCMECNAKFTKWNRRHHCYNTQCGKLVCGQCSDFKISDPKSITITDQIRACKTCYKRYKQQTQTTYNWLESMLKSNLHIVILIIICIILFQDKLYMLLLNLIDYIFNIIT